jgi:hypothetical protein
MEALESELLELERKYWKAIQEKDVETAVSLTDYPCIVAGASGVGSIDRATYRKIMENAPYQLLEFEIRDAQVRILGENLAVVAYEVTEKLIVEGKPLELKAADSSVWIRRNGRWLCTLHTESLAGDSFGRDKVQPLKDEVRVA